MCIIFDQADIFSLTGSVRLMSLFHSQRRKLQHLILASETFGRGNLKVPPPFPGTARVRVSVCVCAAKAGCVKIMEGGGSSHIQWTSEQRTDGGHRAEERRLLAADCCPRCHSHMFTSHIWLERSALTRFVGHPDPNIVSSLTRSSSV